MSGSAKILPAGLLCRFWASSIGKKVVMAITGALMVLFVIGHMTGNLKIFGGVDASTGMFKIDEYALFLRSIGAEMLGDSGFLWLTRIGLLVSVMLHVFAAVSLNQQNRNARPQSYRKSGYQSSTVASRTMFYGGILLLTFVVVHILHFTTGQLHFDGFEHGKVYANVYASFSRWYWVLFYAVAMGALALHLYHGTWSMLQTLGVDTPKWNSTIRLGAKVVAAVVAVGFVSVPLAVFLKVIASPQTQPPTTAYASYANGGAVAGNVTKTDESLGMAVEAERSEHVRGRL